MLILIAGVALLLVSGGALLLLVALSNADFTFLPQDCGGTEIHLMGSAGNASDSVVTVSGEAGLHPSSGGIDLTLSTDADGRFDSGDTYLPVFICEIIEITVSAEGFETQQLRYILLDHYSEDALIALMRTGQPIPISLEIELQEVADA